MPKYHVDLKRSPGHALPALLTAFGAWLKRQEYGSIGHFDVQTSSLADEARHWPNWPAGTAKRLPRDAFAFLRLPDGSQTLLALLLLLLAAQASVRAQGPTFEQPPPADKDLLAKIDALPANTWMKLPAFKVAGDTSWLKPNSDYRRLGPTVRDYCGRMVWAPERQRAVYCGAGHNVHPLNDVWEYDLASNTWICLFAPDPAPPRDDAEWYRKNVVLKDGVVRTPRGAPVRPAHTWWGLCYDTDKKQLVFWDAHKGILFTNYKQLAEAVGLKHDGPELRLSGSGPGQAWVFTFDPATRQWGDVLTKVPKAYESSQLEYLPDRKTLWLHSGKTYLYDAAKREWPTIAKDGPGQAVVSAYDPNSRTIVAAGKRAFVYSCDKQTWSARAELPDGDSAWVPASLMFFDTNAKQFVLCTMTVQKKETPPLRVWHYDLKSDTWSRQPQQGDVPTSTRLAGYYDPARNVTVVYSGREVWVYRSKR